MSFNTDKFKEVLYDNCGCASSGVDGVGGTNKTTSADRTRDIENPPEEALNKNREEIDEMVDSGQIPRYEPDFLEFITGRINQTATSKHVSAFMGKPVGNDVKQLGEDVEMKDLIEKYILNLKEKEEDKEEQISEAEDKKEEKKEEEKKDDKEEKKDDKEEKKDDKKEDEEKDEDEEKSEDKDEEKSEDDEEEKEVKESEEFNIDDIPDELIAECLRAADHDVSLICEETEKVLDELQNIVKEDENIVLDTHEMVEDLVPITSEEDYDLLVDAYTLTVLTGNHDYLEEACLELQKKEEERLSKEEAE